LASIIVDRTHAACGSGMEAPSVAISPLGLVLDLMRHKVLTCMHKKSTTRSNGASTSLGGAGGWTDGRRSETVARSLQRGEREREIVVEEEATATRGRRMGMGSMPPRAVLFIGGSFKSIHCDSFHRTICLNGSIPRSS
jgi:hypothetical protein